MELHLDVLAYGVVLGRGEVEAGAHVCEAAGATIDQVAVECILDPGGRLAMMSRDAAAPLYRR